MNGNFQQGGFEYQEHNDNSKAESQLNLANLILVNLVILIKNMAQLEAKAKYNNITPSSFSTFFVSFKELFDLTSHLIEPAAEKEITDWFEKVEVKETKNLQGDAARGAKLARKLKMELVKLGMLKIFEQPIDPPFMLGCNRVEMEAKLKKEGKL